MTYSGVVGQEWGVFAELEAQEGWEQGGEGGTDFRKGFLALQSRFIGENSHSAAQCWHGGCAWKWDGNQATIKGTSQGKVNE